MSTNQNTTIWLFCGLEMFVLIVVMDISGLWMRFVSLGNAGPEGGV
jgi:hypothetical protein